MNLPESSLWESGVYQLEETDVVRGGPVTDGGISNLQAQQLSNRTRWLYDHLGRVGSVSEKTISADTTLGAADLYNTQVMLTVGTSNKTVTLDLAGLPDNAFTTITVVKDISATPPGCVRIAVTAGVNILGGSYADGLKNRLWLYPGESFTFSKSGNTLFVTGLTGGHDSAGEILYKPFKPPYAVEARGQLVLRSSYPRLFKYVEDNGLLIHDATWLDTPAKQGLFAATGVSTNFRLPDLRGVFLRGLDNSRGLDIDRLYPGEGIYQADEVGSHTHEVDDYSALAPAGQYPKGKWRYAEGGGGAHQGTAQVKNYGGVETRPKNIAYSTYIRF